MRLGASLACLIAVPAAASDLLRLAMPEARMIAGIHGDRFRDSPFGRFLLPFLRGSEEFDSLFAQHREAGFDPLGDTQELVVASLDTAAWEGQLFLLRAKSLETRAAGVTIHGKTAVAVLDSTTIVSGGIDLVRGAMARRGNTTTLDSPLAGAAMRASRGYEVWAVTNLPVARFAPLFSDRNLRAALRGDLLQAVEQSSVAVRLGDTVEVVAEAEVRSERDAASIADVARFLLTLAPARLRQTTIKSEART
ncbi:MAG: hypothetical protein ACRD96_08525, partial [Bryobacteraceae bacterium]